MGKQLICQLETRSLRVITHAPEWCEGWVVEIEGSEAIEHRRCNLWADLHLDLWPSEVDASGEKARLVHLCLVILLESGQDIGRALRETKTFADSRRGKLSAAPSTVAA